MAPGREPGDSHRLPSRLRAGQLARIPPQHTGGVLAYRRFERGTAKVMGRLFPTWEARVRAHRFSDLPEHSQLRQKPEDDRLSPGLHSDDIPRW